MKAKVIISLAAILVLLSANHGDAQGYPVKPVSLMVAYPAGGSTDVGARILASIAEKDLGQPIVVLNKAGAGGQVGWTELARQKPDGYYIGFINLPATNTVILDPGRKAAFGIDSFTPIINQVLDPGVIYAKPEGPYKSFKDLIEDAQKRPGQLRAGTTGILSDDHLAILMLEEAAKVRFRIVHFDGDSPQLTALLSQCRGHSTQGEGRAGQAPLGDGQGKVKILCRCANVRGNGVSLGHLFFHPGHCRPEGSSRADRP
jgi:tripartite-type tricarboxylate transporter receptor subunit TctC